MSKTDKKIVDRFRYGIGEWYGRSFVALTPDERKYYGELQALGEKNRPQQPCLPRGGSVKCSKAGGVCSIRRFQLSPDTGDIAVNSGELVTTCPHRFKENGIIYKWIGEILLGNDQPRIVSEVRFLERTTGETEEEAAHEDVGRIDNVLVHPTREPMLWCAMEIQAVYFSGASMSREFAALREQQSDSVPFPVGHRRPDYRSSGPKRLMPQLQIKVPSLRRWGKKMAVVVDECFFNALGAMTPVKHISNCDVLWFVMKYNEDSLGTKLEPSQVYLTTLESAVEGLTAGSPVSLETFESRIRAKLSVNEINTQASPDLG